MGLEKHNFLKRYYKYLDHITVEYFWENVNQVNQIPQLTH